jgi:hypothetical protein
VILTVSRISAEKRSNPGYRAFFANGYNVTRSLVLFFWEVIVELVASSRAKRRDVRPRGHRGGVYPLLRAAMCVHGGIGGTQTKPFILHPVELELPGGPIVGAATVHTILKDWRHKLQGESR